jgi:hypothetical protein
MEIVMTGSAKDQRLSFSGGHDLDPAWLLPTVVCLPIFPCPDVMHVSLFGEAPCLTHVAYLGQLTFLRIFFAVLKKLFTAL